MIDHVLKSRKLRKYIINRKRKNMITFHVQLLLTAFEGIQYILLPTIIHLWRQLIHLMSAQLKRNEEMIIRELSKKRKRKQRKQSNYINEKN